MAGVGFVGGADMATLTASVSWHNLSKAGESQPTCAVGRL